jgi:sugar phosphate isomerase/epimerase
MKRFSINEVSTFHWTFEEDVARYRTFGFGGIGLWRHKLSDYCDQTIAELVRRSGLAVSSVQWAGGFTGYDGLSFEEAIDDAESAIRLASILNAGCLIVHPGSLGGHTRSHSQRLLASALRKLVPVARDFGVRLALEPMPSNSSRDFTFLNSLETALSFCRDYSPQELGIVVDLFHLGSQASARSTIAEHFERVALVQLSDRSGSASAMGDSRCLLGRGTVRLPEWFAFFESRRYRGLYEVELYGTELYEVDPFDVLEHVVKNVPRYLVPDPSAACPPAPRWATSPGERFSA